MKKVLRRFIGKIPQIRSSTDDGPQFTALLLELHPLFLVLTSGKPFLCALAALRDLLFLKIAAIECEKSFRRLCQPLSFTKKQSITNRDLYLNPLFSITLVSAMNISPVVNKASMKSFDEKLNDLNYWLAQPVIKRLEAVTFLISQSVDLSVTRIDKTYVVRRKLKP